MRKLAKDKAIRIAEYAHYVQRHANYEQALFQAIANYEGVAAQDRLINNARWAAKEAIAAANRLGLDSKFIQSDILQRAE